MGQVLHGSALTTEVVRQAIQHRKDSLRALAWRQGVKGEERRHARCVAVDRRNTRWCSDALGIGCDNGEQIRVVFALDCCDREAMGPVATTDGITAEDIRDLMVATVERRSGPVNCLAEPIEWLTDNDSPYVAGETKRFAPDIDPLPHAALISSPKSNGVAEGLARTLKRDYVRVNPRPEAHRHRAAARLVGPSP